MRTVLYILFGLIGSCAFGQVPYTNVVNHLAHNSRPALEIVGDYYFVANNLNTAPWTLDYTKLDTNGTVIQRFSYVVDSAQFPSNCPKCLDYHNGVLYHGYTDFISVIPGTDTSAIILCKVKPDLSDTIMTRYYPTLQGHGLDIKALEFDSDSTFIIAATDAYYTGDSAPQAVFKFNTLVARLDTSFNILWETIIPDTDPNRNFGLNPEDIVVDSYGTLLVTGTPYWVGWVNEAFAARLNNKSGQLLWRKNYNGDMGIQGMNAFDHGDGTYRYVQNWLTNPNDYYHQLHIGILDTAGNIIADSVYGKPNKGHAIHELIKLKDGNYYCGGVTNLGLEKGLGFKFSPQLDSLWMRNYRYGSVNNTCYLEVFKEDSSGMIAHTGWVTSNQLDNWIFRIDTYGCDTSNCGLNIPENFRPDERWTVYPNPSRGEFVIDHPEIEVLGPLIVQVFDLQGRRVHDGDYEGGRAIQLELETSGEYQILITTESGEVIGIIPILITP